MLLTTKKTFPQECCLQAKNAQHSVHPTGGSRRVYKHFPGFRFILLPGVVSSRPPAGNASRWADNSIIDLRRHENMETQAPPSAASPAQLALIQKKLQLDHQIRSGVDWFFWIAGLSLINSAVYLLGNNFVFFLGLGITQFVDGFMSALASEFSSGGNIIRLIGFAVDVFVAGIFVLFGVFGRKRYKMPVVLGMILYAVDGVIVLLLQDFLSAGLHAFALLGIWNGLKSMSELGSLEKDGNSESIESIRNRVPTPQLRVPPQLTLQEKMKRWLLLGIILLGIVFLFVLESILR